MTKNSIRSEEDGARLNIWDGLDYAILIIEAEGARVEFGIAETVRDRIGGAA